MTKAAAETMVTSQEINGQADASQKRRVGAPANNQNRTTHGCRARDADRYGLTGVAYPDGCNHIEANVNTFRRGLEDAVKAARTRISIVDATLINRAARSEAQARLAARAVARWGDEMAHETRRSYMLDVGRETKERDRAVADLELEAKHLASLYTLANGSVDV